MVPRFYAPDASEGSQGDIVLSEEESGHATRVLRLRVGDEVTIFDGRGHEWQARIAGARRSEVTVHLETPLVPAVESRVRLILLQGVIKGDHMDSVVRDVTMLGVADIRPVITAHTVVSATAAAGVRARTRWLRVALASAKQCRRAVVPLVSTAAVLQDALEEPAISACDRKIVLAEPATGRTPATGTSGTPRSAVIAVGPEGGWSHDELITFERAGFEFLTLGVLTLRADAAAVVALSVLRERWGDL